MSSHELDLLFKQPVDADITIELSTFSGVEIRNYMKGLTQELSKCADDFEQIPVYMQTGKDMQALKLLGVFSEKLNELYRSLLLSDVTELPFDIQIEGKSVHEYQKEITPLVKTLINGVSLTLN